MKKIILTLSFALIGTFMSYSQDLSSPQGGGVLNIESVTPGDGYSKMNFKGDIITDDLCMNGLKRYSMSERIKKSVLSGNTILLFCDPPTNLAKNYKTKKP